MRHHRAADILEHDFSIHFVGVDLALNILDLDIAVVHTFQFERRMPWNGDQQVGGSGPRTGLDVDHVIILHDVEAGSTYLKPFHAVGASRAALTQVLAAAGTGL